MGTVDFTEGVQELIELLKRYRGVVAVEGDKLGRTEVTQHKIVFEPNAKPFFIPNYKLPISRREAIADMIKKRKKE